MSKSIQLTPTTSRAALYVRVSSAGQAEDGTSLDTQEAGCRAFADARALRVLRVEKETHTGVELWERPCLTALRAAIRAREIDVVICHSIDRLARDPVHLGVVLSEADHAGVEVLFVTEPLDDSPEGALIRFVRGYAAKVEHEKIKERTQRGKLARIASGKPPVGPRPPFGMTWSDGAKTRLVENPMTAPVVRRIFREIAAGSSARQLGLRLTAEGIPTPTGKQHWHATTIAALIRHPTYIGDVTANRWRMDHVKGRGKVFSRRPTSDHVVVPGVTDGLVSRDLAREAQARLVANRQESVRNNAAPEAALFRGGYARCGYCGSALQADNGHWGTVYRCNTTARDRHGCPGFTIKAEILDGAVWPGVRARLQDPALIARELERLRRDDPTSADVTALDRRRAEIEHKQRNLMNRLAASDDADVGALIMADLSVLADQRRQLVAEREDLDRQRQAWQQAQQGLEDLDLWMRNVAANLEDIEADYARKRFALNACGFRVRVWATDHSPRWHATIRLGDGAPIEIADTTTGACVRNTGIVVSWTDRDTGIEVFAAD